MIWVKREFQAWKIAKMGMDNDLIMGQFGIGEAR